MKMNELIDSVSIIYREEMKKEDDMRNELYSIINTLDDKGEDVTLAEYNKLIKRKEKLIEDVNLKREYCNGISCVREFLMGLGFDTEVKQIKG